MVAVPTHGTENECKFDDGSNSPNQVLPQPVVVRRADVHEGSMVSKCKHAKSQTIQDVDHARDAGKLSKGHHPLALDIAHPLKYEECRDVFSSRALMYVQMYLRNVKSQVNLPRSRRGAHSSRGRRPAAPCCRSEPSKERDGSQVRHLHLPCQRLQD